jgi:5-(carboxyamino)imidazole ribonucleotide mutase
LFDRLCRVALISIGGEINERYPPGVIKSLSGVKHNSGNRGEAAVMVKVGVIMGSRSDWETMRHAADVLQALEIDHECKVVSAHRTPDRLVSYAKAAAGRGINVIIAGAGGAAHLPGMVAAMTRLPVLGVPVQSAALSGMDSLLSIVQMPGGIPVGTLAIGKPGAINAGLLAAAILANGDSALATRLEAWRAAQTEAVADTPE